MSLYNVPMLRGTGFSFQLFKLANIRKACIPISFTIPCVRRLCFFEWWSLAFLGRSKDASNAGIRAAYRKLAVQLHPDKGPCLSLESAVSPCLSAFPIAGGDPEAFAEMQAAYQILCSAAWTAFQALTAPCCHIPQHNRASEISSVAALQMQ